MNSLFNAALVMYLLATVAYLGGMAARRESWGKAGYVLLALGGAFNTAAIAIMTWKAHRIPFTNTFETLVLFSWLIVAACLAFEKMLDVPVAGAAVSPLALLFLGYAGLQGDVELRPLIPALKSNWLLAHVTSYFIAYAVAAISYGLGTLYLLVQEGADRGARAARIFGAFNVGLVAGAIAYFAGHLLLARLDAVAPMPEILQRFRISIDPIALGVAVVVALAVGIAAPRFRSGLRSRLPAEDRLDRVIEYAIRFSFPFMTLGIVTGAVWANETWGTYWSWDPKETWALVTWLIYAAYLHARIVTGWRGRATVAMAVAGFLVIVFTYFGVNYLLSGLHSYA